LVIRQFGHWLLFVSCILVLGYWCLVMIKANISEIFKSIQGEGKYAGVRQVFVRFYGCNIHCAWCDTPASIGDSGGKFEEYSLRQVLDKVAGLGINCHSVSLTGGEPMVQSNFLKELLPLIKQTKLKIYLDTNGIFYQELKTIIDDLDIIAMDIKLPSSTKCQSYWQEHEEFLKEAHKKDVFIKAVISSDTSKGDVVQAAELIAKVDRQILFIIQPNYFDMKNDIVKKCCEFQDYCLQYLSDVRVMPQMHKFMKVR